MRLSPTPAGLALLVSVLSLVFLRPPGPLSDLLLAGLAALLGTGALWAWRTDLRALRVRRRLPSVATKGEALTVIHEVEHDGRHLLRDLHLSELDRGAGSTFFPLLAPGGLHQAATRVFAGQRGLLALSGISLEAGDPWGLFLVRQVRPLRDEVLVRPRPRAAPAALLAGAGPASAPSPPSERWDTIREWRPGDPPRWVHWRLSARRGFPVVKLSRQAQDRGALVILDRSPPPGSPRQANRRFEAAVALAAGVGLAALERGQGALTFLAPGAEEPLELTGLRGREGRAALLQALAQVRIDELGLAALSPDVALQRAVLISGGDDPPPGLPRPRLFLPAAQRQAPVTRRLAPVAEASP